MCLIIKLKLYKQQENETHITIGAQTTQWHKNFKSQVILTEISQKIHIRIVNGCMTKYSMSLAKKEMQIKIIQRSYVTPDGMTMTIKKGSSYILLLGM